MQWYNYLQRVKFVHWWQRDNDFNMKQNKVLSNWNLGGKDMGKQDDVMKHWEVCVWGGVQAFHFELRGIHWQGSQITELRHLWAQNCAVNVLYSKPLPVIIFWLWLCSSFNTASHSAFPIRPVFVIAHGSPETFLSPRQCVLPTAIRQCISLF